MCCALSVVEIIGLWFFGSFTLGSAAVKSGERFLAGAFDCPAETDCYVTKPIHGTLPVKCSGWLHQLCQAFPFYFFLSTVEWNTLSHFL